MRHYIILIALLLLGVAGTGTTITEVALFDKYCGEHMVRAARANTVAVAADELSQAVQYCNTHGLTEGHTSLIWDSPDDDVGFWYKNMVSCLREVQELKDGGPADLKALSLMKIRGSLIKHMSDGKPGLDICPAGISFHPCTLRWTFILWSGILSFIGAIIYIIWRAG